MPLIDDHKISVSALGEALLALDQEIARLQQEACMYYKRLQHVTDKQLVCQEAIKKLLCEANGGVYPQRPPVISVPGFYSV